MYRPFRFGEVVSHAQSHADWIAIAHRAEELGYATLLLPDRTTIGGLSPLTALAVAVTCSAMNIAIQ